MGTSNVRRRRANASDTYSDMLGVEKSDIVSVKEGQRLEVPGGFLEIMKVTPEFAAELLAHKHPDQRVLRHHHVDQLARAMSTGQWHATMAPIALDPDLRVIDGQHRLNAVVKSGITITFLLAILTDPKAFYAIDQNAVRSLNDVRKTMGKPAINRVLSGAIFMEHRNFARRTSALVNKEEMDEVLESFPFMDELRELEVIGRKGKIVGVGVLAAAIACMRVNKPEAMKFFSAVLTLSSVIDGKEVSAAHLLYLFLSSTREQGQKRATGEFYLRETAWKSLRAWNAWRANERLSRLIYGGAGDSMPKPRR